MLPLAHQNWIETTAGEVDWRECSAVFELADCDGAGGRNVVLRLRREPAREGLHGLTLKRPAFFAWRSDRFLALSSRFCDQRFSLGSKLHNSSSNVKTFLNRRESVSSCQHAGVHEIEDDLPKSSVV